MTSSVRIFGIPDVNARDPSAICATCGRRGTWAVIAYEEAPASLERFCRRCWPNAHELAAQETAAAAEAHWVAQQEWVMESSGRDLPPPAPPELPRRVLVWHWTLTISTWWRSFRHDRALLAAVRRSAT